MRNTIMNQDTDLSMHISDALLENPKTKNAVIEVINDRGMVTLQGKVKDIEAKNTAEAIAADYPGVISVTNELSVEHR